MGKMKNSFTTLKTRICSALAAALVSAALICGSAAAAPNVKPEAKKVFDKVMSTFLNDIDSHKYLWNIEGYDKFSKERQKEMAGHYDDIAKKQGAEVEISENVEIKRGGYIIEFKKPYLTQMEIVKSDFVPVLLNGSLITYRSDKKQNKWYVKPKISPVAVGRSIEKDDAGGAITAGWPVVLLYLQYYHDNAATVTLQPDATFDGKKCKVIRLTFDWKKTPAWNKKKPPFAKFAVPAPIEKIIWDGMLDIEQQKFSHIDYFVDAKQNVVVKTEEYINGKFHWRNTFTKIEINKLTEKDF